MSHEDLQGAPIESSGKMTKSHFSNQILKDNNNYDIKVILSENYRENNGFFTNNKENYKKIINTLLFHKK